MYKNKFSLRVFLMVFKKSFLQDLLVIVILGIGACCIEWIYGRLKNLPTLNEYRAIWFFVITLICYITYKYRRKIYQYAHIYLFVVVMLIGTVQTIATPTVVGVSWDDEIHYGRTAYLSWGAGGKISYADNRLITHYTDVIYQQQEYTESGRVAWENEINNIDKDYKMLVDTSSYHVELPYIAYIPSAIALAFGRGFGLSFVNNFILGKWVNLLIYALVLSYSIRILKRGKLAVAAIGLIPTNIFLAASYSYDWWITCFVILGYSMFAGVLQSQKKIETKKLIVIMAVMIIGILPKAIYFPLLFPMMLLNKERYENPKVQRMFVVLAMVFLMATFILPMLIGGAGTGDIRGGSDVNATEQIKFILSQPMEYTKILIKFLIEYLSLDVSYMYLTFFAYMGQAKYYTICICAIVVGCIMDNSFEEVNVSENRRVKAGTALGAAGSIVLAATALYISFTPVGYSTVLGCQWRYIIPVLFPVLFVFSKIKMNVSEKVKANTFAIMTVVLAMVYLYGLYDLAISRFMN